MTGPPQPGEPMRPGGPGSGEEVAHVSGTGPSPLPRNPYLRRRRHANPDPTSIERLVTSVMQSRGWKRQLEIAQVQARWEMAVGAAVAAHCVPVSLTAEGVLEVRADSAAWATQLTYLQGKLLGRLAQEVGAGRVVALRVRTAGGRGRTS